MSFVSNRRWLPRLSCAAALAALGVAVPLVAAAEVTRKGAWPEGDPTVSLEVTGVSRSDALRRLAKEAQWSLLLEIPQGKPVDLQISDQPAGKVLDLLLSDGRYIARRDGDLISISLAENAAPSETDIDVQPRPTPWESAIPPVPPVPPVPPIPPVPELSEDDAHGASPDNRGRNRFSTGGSLRIEKGEVVNDVSVIGGSLDVWGTVTGDVAVMGGSTHIHEGAVVRGDVSTVGGLKVDDGARIRGDVQIVGGLLERGETSIIDGDVNSEDARHADDREDAGSTSASELAQDAGSAVTRTALLFVFGAVLLSLWPRHMGLLKSEIAARPMKSLALGVVGVLGAIGLIVALCVTLVGIPFAVIGCLLGVVAAVAGCCAVLETAGGAALNHRTKNPYVHLAAGCVAMLVMGAIPYVGDVLSAVVFLIGVGSLVSTRLAGLIPEKRGTSSVSASPYREPA